MLEYHLTEVSKHIVVIKEDEPIVVKRIRAILLEIQQNNLLWVKLFFKNGVDIDAEMSILK